MVCLLLLALTAVMVQVGGEGNSDCPLWTYRKTPTSKCECGTTANGLIECDLETRTLRLQVCACLTHNSSTNTSIAGFCIYSCAADLYRADHVVHITTNTSDNTCKFNRAGPLCSKCIDNHGIPLYTYTFDCVKCSKFRIMKLVKYLSKSLLPPTILFLAMIVVHIHVLQPPMGVFVLAAQVISTPIVLQSALNVENNNSRKQLLTFSATFYGIWNLDFFKAIYTPECVNPDITTLQAYTIEGLVGLYPIALSALLYIFVTVRSRGYRLAFIIHYIASRFRGTFNLKESIVGTFTTLFLLSYMKIGFAAFYVLSPTQVWSPNGHYYWAVYVEPSMPYFRSSHAVYGCITIVLALILVVFPILLLLFYPHQWCQRFLNYCKLKSIALNMVVDVFQGCYKDGTNGTRDYRYFAAFQLMLRLFLPLVFFSSKESNFSIFISSIVLGAYITAFVIARPYKVSVYNNTDVPILMTVLCLTVTQNASILFQAYGYKHHLYIINIIFVSGFFIPLVYLAVWSFIYAKSVVIHRGWCKKSQSESDELLPHS